MDGEEEWKGEEGNDDQVYETDSDGRDNLRGVERPQTELREADGRAEGLRGPLEVGARDAGIREDHACPRLAELGSYLGLQRVQFRQDVIVVSVLVSSFDPYYLAGS